MLSVVIFLASVLGVGIMEGKWQKYFSEYADLKTGIIYGAGIIAFSGLMVAFKKLNVFSRILYKVDPNSSRHGGEMVAKVLKSHNVEYMFTLSGGHISPILAAAEQAGIRIIDTRHEVNAVFAADAVSRLSGKIGVVAVTAGPGLTNTITAVKNAQMAESPVLLMGGAAATLLKGRGALQDIDQMSLFKSLCKFCATVETVRDIAPTLRRAIKEAQSGTPGPVFVEFPIDVLYPYQVIRKELGTKPPKSITQRFINWYLLGHTHNVFGNAFDDKIPTEPLKPEIPMPKFSHVTRAAELLSRAKKPLILLGSQSMLPPQSALEVRAALENLGVPCFLGGMARGLLGPSHPLHIRQRRGEALKDADVVILAGTICDFRLSYGRVLSPRSKIIAVNRDREQLYKNSDAFWKPTLAVQSDVGSFLHQLSAALPQNKVDPDWLALLRSRNDEKEQKNEAMAEDIPEKHLNPLKVLKELDKTLPGNTILVADGGDFVATAAYTLRARGPLTWLDPGAFGTLGVGAGFALGAKLVNPDSHVVIIYGDGSLGYSLIEMDTFTRHKLPVLAVVGNDASWMQIERGQVQLLGTSVACKLEYTDYHKAAEGLGAKGMLLGASDKDQLAASFNHAHQIVANEKKSLLVNCLLGTTKFRDGSLSV